MSTITILYALFGCFFFAAALVSAKVRHNSLVQLVGALGFPYGSTSRLRSKIARAPVWGMPRVEARVPRPQEES
jgi:hypothetical protein